MVPDVLPSTSAYPPPIVTTTTADLEKPPAMMPATAYPAQPIYPPPAAPYVSPPPPPAVAYAYAAPTTTIVERRKWKESLFGCSDCRTCCCGLWCPCVLYGENYEKLNMGSNAAGCVIYFALAFLFCQCIPGVAIRQTMHRTYNLKGGCLGACCAYLWCAPCAICQDTREIAYQQGTGQFAVASTVPRVAPPQDQTMAA